MATEVAARPGPGVDGGAVQELKQSFRGELLRPGEAGYEETRRVWNGSIDRRPALIARCTGARDIISAVHFAKRHGLLLAVRGGGHNVAGLGVCDGGLVADLSRMKGIRVDTRQRVARAEPGLVWGDFDHETQAHGLAAPGGLMSTTGIAGFTLGGGFGWLSRKYGLACDNLLEADVVTAEGELVRASPDENPDLFWGIRGGGGNFGVISSFKYRLHPVGPEVLCGSLFFPAADAPLVLRFFRDFMPSAPDELFLTSMLRTAPAASFLPASAHGTSVISLGLCYAGPIDAGERVVQPIRRVGRPLADVIMPRPYTAWQQFLDPGWGPGFQNYWKAEYLAHLDDTAIGTIVEYAAKMPSPVSDIKIAYLRGAIAQVGPGDSAYTHREAPFLININTRWEAQSDGHIRWTGDFWSAVRPFSAGGVYVNFLGQEGSERVREAYGQAKYERLIALKNRYDPTNRFRVNQNIPPSVGGTES